MNIKEFEQLDTTIQMTLLLSMYVRNEMEDFHVQHLSDSQMKELNPIIRQGIYNALTYWKFSTRSNDDEQKLAAIKDIDFHIKSIPEYWELPDTQIPIQNTSRLASLLISLQRFHNEKIANKEKNNA